MSTRYYQLKKLRGQWTVLAVSNTRSALPERKGAVVVEASHNTGFRKLEELAEAQGPGAKPATRKEKSHE